MRTLLIFLTGVSLAHAYVRFEDSPGVYEHRADNTNIQMLLNQNAKAGLNNADGTLWITSGSNVTAAIAAALSSWNRVSSANIHFLPIQSTTELDGNLSTNDNVIAFDDTSETRQAIGEAIAITERYITTDNTGTIAKTDIIFSPTLQFSTDLSANTFDIQSIASHELGHCLGADHTGVLSGTMFQTTGKQLVDQARLHPDDVAYVSATYPVSSSNYGTVTGTVADSTGKVLHGALITAQDTDTDIIVGGFSDFDTGQFTFVAPAGTYQIWAEPLNGQVQAANLYLSSSQTPDTNWQPVLSSSPISVSAGATVSASLVAPVGTSTVTVKFSGAVPSTDNSNFSIYQGPAIVPTGGPGTDYFVIDAPGLGSDFTDADISFIGPVSVQPGTVMSLGSNQYGMILNVPAVASQTFASMFISYHGNVATLSGGIILEPPAPSFPANGVGNAFSYASGAVAPGELVSIFGTNLGPTTGISGGFDSNSYLSTIVAGVQVTFDGTPAPIVFASAGQINVEVPYEVSGQSSTNILINNGTAGTAVTIPVASSVPGLFTSAVNPDGSLNSASNPVTRGNSAFVVLYSIGLGALSGVTTGLDVAGAAQSAPVSVSIAGQNVSSTYAGATPGFTGLDQVNVPIPSSLPSGQVPVFVSINGQVSQTIQLWLQ